MLAIIATEKVAFVIIIIIRCVFKIKRETIGLCELHFLASVSRARLLNINLKRSKGFMLNEDVSVISSRIESKKKLRIRQTVTVCLNNIIYTNQDGIVNTRG